MLKQQQKSRVLEIKDAPPVLEIPTRGWFIGATDFVNNVVGRFMAFLKRQNIPTEDITEAHKDAAGYLCDRHIGCGQTDNWSLEFKPDEVILHHENKPNYGRTKIR